MQTTPPDPVADQADAAPARTPEAAANEAAAPQQQSLAALLADLSAQLQALTERVAQLEQRQDTPHSPPPDRPDRHAGAAPAETAAAAGAQAEITEDELLNIAAAVAAYLGVRARVRQVRLVQSTAWAQVGRATIHASHRMH